MNVKLPINILGVMSGTSLDGLDLALCQFYEEKNSVQFKIIEAKTFHFSLQWQNKLQQLVDTSARQYVASDIAFGKLIGEYINKFKVETSHKIDYIASHGHTIFHEPEQGYTAQIGDANAIMAETGISTITDFRQLDVQFGGTGAPLVPIGDRDLFPKSVCINLGGICNLSYLNGAEMIALDICPFNLPLNFIAKKLGANYDNNGMWARSGSLIPELLDELNQIDYFKKTPPKSLDKTWVEHTYFPIIEAALTKYLEADILNTLVKHYTLQVQTYLVQIEAIYPHYKIILTGGGAYHQYFIDELSKATFLVIEQVSNQVIEFKEAMIFAYLGYLRLQNRANCLSSVTGASKDISAGLICSI